MRTDPTRPLSPAFSHVDLLYSAGNTPDMVNRVGLHVVKDEEVKGKKPEDKGR